MCTMYRIPVWGIRLELIKIYFYYTGLPGHYFDGKIRETENQFGLALVCA